MGISGAMRCTQLMNGKANNDPELAASQRNEQGEGAGQQSAVRRRECPSKSLELSVRPIGPDSLEYVGTRNVRHAISLHVGLGILRVSLSSISLQQHMLINLFRSQRCRPLGRMNNGKDLRVDHTSTYAVCRNSKSCLTSLLHEMVGGKCISLVRSCYRLRAASTCIRGRSSSASEYSGRGVRHRNILEVSHCCKTSTKVASLSMSRDKQGCQGACRNVWSGKALIGR